eukprot:COSAG05_NODE_11267_length_522_cov_0.832151_1_plen_82_part_00
MAGGQAALQLAAAASPVLPEELPNGGGGEGGGATTPTTGGIGGGGGDELSVLLPQVASTLNSTYGAPARGKRGGHGRPGLT